MKPRMTPNPAPVASAAPQAIASCVAPGARWRVSPLVLAGLLLMALGGAGDVAHHALPPGLSATVDPLVGMDGHRAHFAAFLGMLAILARVLSRAFRP